MNLAASWGFRTHHWNSVDKKSCQGSPLCFDFSSLLRGVFIFNKCLFSTSAYFRSARFWAQITLFGAISRFWGLEFVGFLGSMLDFSKCPILGPPHPLLGNLRSCRSAIAPMWRHFERHTPFHPYLVPPKNVGCLSQYIWRVYAKWGVFPGKKHLA